MGLIDELSHALVARYRRHTDPAVLADGLRFLGSRETDPAVVDHLLLAFTDQFPNTAVFSGQQTPAEWLAASTPAAEAGSLQPMPNREAALEELLLLWLANINPAFAPFQRALRRRRPRRSRPSTSTSPASSPTTSPRVRPSRPKSAACSTLCARPCSPRPTPSAASSTYMREHWAEVLGPSRRPAPHPARHRHPARGGDRHLAASSIPPGPDQSPPRRAHGWGAEGFVGDEFVGFDEFRRSATPTTTRPAPRVRSLQPPTRPGCPTSSSWPRAPTSGSNSSPRNTAATSIASTRSPTKSSHLLADRGITGLWLIGLWERSIASQTIKRLRGQHDAVASAYSLKDYRHRRRPRRRLRLRATSATAPPRHGIRLASDMVPNHMGIDSPWVIEHPDWFLYRWRVALSRPTASTAPTSPPTPASRSRSKTTTTTRPTPPSSSACATTRNGDTRYVYHGNDGTTFAWNDTAQLDYSKAVRPRAGHPDHPARRAALPHHPLRRRHGARQAPRPAPLVPAARRRRLHPLARRKRHDRRRSSTPSCPTSSGARSSTASPPRSPAPCCSPRPSGCSKATSSAPSACIASTTAPS